MYDGISDLYTYIGWDSHVDIVLHYKLLWALFHFTFVMDELSVHDCYDNV